MGCLEPRRRKWFGVAIDAWEQAVRHPVSPGLQALHVATRGRAGPPGIQVNRPPRPTLESARAARPEGASRATIRIVSSPGHGTGLPTRREGAIAVPARRPRFEPKPGLLVDEKYKVDEVIGEGGMGIVVSATHVGLGQRVAIKFLLPEARRNAEVVERFLREARIAARVKSEHVARVSDVGTVGDDGTPFLVMEHLEGADLGAILRRDGALPVEEACEITLQACEALAEVHAAGIVHRDLKPSNLFVTRRADGSPCLKLLDFGISKLTDAGGETDDPALTATAAIMGSPAYMSPEQLRSTKEVDARSDVWSLGAVLYEAVTGRGAFRRETVPQVCAMIASEEPAPPSSLQASIPAALERAILGCLVKDPERRSTLLDLAREIVDLAPDRARVSLERVEAMQGTDGSRPRAASRPRQPSQARSITARSVSTADERARPGRSRWPLLVVLAAMGVVGAGIATGRIDLHKLGGQVAGAASSLPPMPSIPAMPPLASVVAPIASAVAPIASALEDPGGARDPEPEVVEEPAPSSSVTVPSGLPAAGRSVPRALPAKQTPRAKPGPGKVRHRRH
jgi:eukaryotic-like serine/threonine-protein kinase